MAARMSVSGLSLVPKGPALSRQAFDETAAERAALTSEEVWRVSLDLEAAVGIALATAERLAPYLEQIRTLPVSFERVEQLRRYALAAAAAHAEFRASVPESDGLQALYDEARTLRKRMRFDATNLALNGLLSRNALDGIVNKVGYRNVAYDLMALVTVFRAATKSITGRTAITPATLDRAETVGNELVERAALRQRRKKYTLEAADARRRAFTLLARAYEEARRAATCLFWERDKIDAIAPALHAAPGAGRPKRPPAPPPPEPPPEPDSYR